LTPRRRVLLLVGALAVAAAVMAASVLVPARARQGAFVALDAGPEGASSFVASLARGRGADATREVLVDPQGFASRGARDQAALVLLAPSVAATPQEQAWLRAFVSGGGTLLLAGEAGPANSYLEGVAASRFGPRVLDFRFEGSPAHPVMDAPTFNASSVTLDHPSSILAAPGAEVLAATSATSFLDPGRGRPAPTSALASFPWLARERVGAGEVILVGDAPLLANAWKGTPGADVVRDGLARLVASRGTVRVDEAHRPAPSEALAQRAAGLPVLPVAAVLLLAFLGAALLFARPAGGGSRDPRGTLRAWLFGVEPEPDASRAALQKALRERHPEWDPDLVDAALGARE